ncbi:MAG: hypothetical protein MJ231_06150 [bacterium]|nr:hypothetical protein [bacterium]
MNITSKEQIKIIMAREGITAKKLAEILTQKTGKKYTQQSILHKVFLSSFRYDEIKTVADLFGYKISIEK